MWWHNDPSRDMHGRTVEQIVKDIFWQYAVIKIRESYPAVREGYHIRTAEIRRNLEIDKEQLVGVLEAIRQSERNRK